MDNMDNLCKVCSGRHTTGECTEEKSDEANANKESGGKKTHQDVIKYFQGAAKYMNKEFLPRGNASAGDKYFFEKVMRYDEIAQLLQMDLVKNGRDTETRKVVLGDALRELQSDYEVSSSKGPEDNMGETFGFKKEDISQLVDFIRSELGMKPSGMTEDEIARRLAEMKNITIK